MKDAISGYATRKKVDILFSGPGGTGKLRIPLFIPNNAHKHVPTFLLICHSLPDNIYPSRKVKKPFRPAERIVQRGYAASVPMKCPRGAIEKIDRSRW